MISVLLLVAGVAGLLLILARTKQNPPNWQMESVSALAGLQGRPSFSPDANSIVFNYQGEQDVHSDIYLKVIGDEKMLRLTNPPGASFGAAWSPNGQAIAYTHWLEANPARFSRDIMLMTPLGAPNASCGGPLPPGDSAGRLPGPLTENCLLMRMITPTNPAASF